MEEKLKSYMENLFRDMPDTQQAREIKEEILQNIIDKYHDLLAEGKSEEAAYNIAIEGIGDLSELLDSLREKDSGGQNSSGPAVKVDSSYMEWKKRSAILTAVGVMMYILSIIPPIICDEMGMNDGIGACGMFLLCAVATAILIFNHMTKPVYTKNGDTMADEFMEWKHKKDIKKQSWESIKGALWCLIVVLYFVISFATQAWYITWVIFPFGAFIESLIKAVMLNKEEKTAGFRASLVVSAILFGISILILVGFLISRMNNGNFSLFSFGGTHYADAGKYTAGNVTLTPDTSSENPLSEIHIDWIDGAVSVCSVEGLEAIEITEKDSEKIKEEDRVHTYYHDGVLDIQYRESGLSFFETHAKGKELQVKIPASLAGNIKEIDGDFVSTAFTVEKIKTESLNIDTVSGDSYLDLLDAPSDFTADCVSADITVTLPKTASFEAEMDSVSGDLDCTMPSVVTKEDEDDNKYIQCGGSSRNEFDFDSVSGDVIIRPAQ